MRSASGTTGGSASTAGWKAPECRSTEQEPELTVSAADLGAAYLGAVGFQTMFRAGTHRGACAWSTRSSGRDVRHGPAAVVSGQLVSELSLSGRLTGGPDYTPGDILAVASDIRPTKGADLPTSAQVRLGRHPSPAWLAGSSQPACEFAN